MSKTGCVRVKISSYRLGQVLIGKLCLDLPSDAEITTIRPVTDEEEEYHLFVHSSEYDYPIVEAKTVAT